MQNFQDAFKTPKQLFVSAFSIRMTVPLSFYQIMNIKETKVIQSNRVQLRRREFFTKVSV